MQIPTANTAPVDATPAHTDKHALDYCESYALDLSKWLCDKAVLSYVALSHVSPMWQEHSSYTVATGQDYCHVGTPQNGDGEQSKSRRRHDGGSANLP